MTLSLFKLSSFFNISLNTSSTESSQLSLQEAMIISACLAAADEVSALSLIKSSEYPKLSAILFGEGVVNDAISILLFHSVVTVPRMGTTLTGGTTTDTDSPTGGGTAGNPLVTVVKNVTVTVTDHLLAAAAKALTVKEVADDDDGTDDPYATDSPSPDYPSPSPTSHHHHHDSDDSDEPFSSSPTSFSPESYLPSLSPTPSPTSDDSHHHSSIPQIVTYWDVKFYSFLSTTFSTLAMAIVVGVGSGLLISRLLKVYPEMRKSPVHQTAIFALGAYISFCVSDALEYVGKI